MYLLVTSLQLNHNAWNGKHKIYFEDFTFIWEDNIRMNVKQIVL